jgi:hypothetical protein
MQDVILKVAVTNPSDIVLGTMAETVLDGADVTQGALADAAATDSTSSWSVVALLKGLFAKVNKHSTLVRVTPTLTTTPYSIGDTLGGIQTITGATAPNGTGTLNSLHLTDIANQKKAMDIFIFESNPAAATTTDNAAFVFSTDTAKLLARVSVAGADYATVAGVATAVKSGLNITVKGNGGTSLYAVAVTSETPTYAAASLVFVWGTKAD